MLEASTTRWSSWFHLLITLFERYNIITYSVYLICYPGSLLVTKMDCMMVEYTAKSTWTV